MDNQLAARAGSVGGDSASVNSGSGREMEENEDEKIYYGFGVFMGLPLADLKAMKEDFIEQQQQQSRLPPTAEHTAASSSRAPGLPLQGRPERIADEGYGRRMEQDARLAPAVGGPRHPASNGYHRREEGRDPSYSDAGADQRYYDRNGDGNDSSDEGMAAKSHSINYILH